jgi:hypothetical protein
MARIRADNPQRATAAHMLAFLAHLFDGRFYFHAMQSLLKPAGDPRSPTIRVELDSDFVADQDSDAVQPHLPGQVRDRQLARGELDAEQCVRKGLFDHSVHNLWFSHILRDEE